MGRVRSQKVVWEKQRREKILEWLCVRWGFPFRETCDLRLGPIGTRKRNCVRIGCLWLWRNRG